jgi:phage terminase large subunit-like protein
MADYNYEFNFPRGYDPAKTPDADKYYFDEEEFNRYVTVIESCIFHNKGVLVGQTLKLEKWQKDIVAALFCLKDKDTDKRRYKESLIYVPRKNGKSMLCSALGGAYLLLDSEKGKQVVSAAGSRDQASLIHGPLKFSIMNEKSPLQSPDNTNPNVRFKCYGPTKRIVSENELNEYFPITADAGKQHGLNVSFAILDEIHTWPLQQGMDLFEAISTSQGARENPLLISITTADHNRDSLCNRKVSYAQQVASGKVDDPTFLPVLYYLTIDDDWEDEDNWKAVNPNLGVSVNMDFYHKEFNKAKNDPMYENSFKRLYLNIQTRAETKFLDYNIWDQSADPEACSVEALAKSDCYAGLDLAFKTDLCAFVLVFPLNGKYHVKTLMWIPEEHKEIEFYQSTGWLNSKEIITTSGNGIDFAQIKKDILEFIAPYNVVEMGYDPRFATELCQSLYNEHNLPVVEVPQTVRYLSEPLKSIQASILDRKFVHDGNNCASWQVGNATAKTDEAGNIKLIKPQGKDRTLAKVDFVAALSIAYSCLLRNDESNFNSALREKIKSGNRIL